MAKAAILYRLDTLELDGAVMFSDDADLRHYPEDPTIHGVIEIPLNHPVLHEQLRWQLTGNLELVRKDVA